jgi:hypothetical protein
MQGTLAVVIKVTSGSGLRAVMMIIGGRRGLARAVDP